MTLARLEEEMSSSEFEMWVAFDMLKQDECPSCGTEARDIGQFEVRKVRCPTCKHEYGKVRRWQSVLQPAPH